MNQDVTIDLEPMFKSGEDVGTPFEVTLDIEIEDDKPFKITLTGNVAIYGTERYVAFDTLADGNSSIGRIQREWSRLNQLFIVDRQKVLDTIEAHNGKVSTETKEAKNGKSK